MNHIIKAVVILCMIACQQERYKYPENPNLTHDSGLPKDSLAFYFSTFTPFDSSQAEFVADSFWQNYLGANLFAFKEPILFNSYLGYDAYRFLWLRSFHLPMVLTITNNNGLITLETKKLDRQPLFYDRGYGPPDPVEDSLYKAQGYEVFQKIDSIDGQPMLFSIVKADRRAKITYTNKKVLGVSEWRHFEKILSSAKFWNLKPYNWAGHADGAAWIIEAHLKSRYKYVVRQSPNGKLYEVGKYLLELSRMKEELY